MTTAIWPAGTCTHGNFFTPKTGQSLNRRPGISSSAWKPASPWKAIGLSSLSFFSPNRFVTRPTSVGPIWIDRLERRDQHDDGEDCGNDKSHEFTLLFGMPTRQYAPKNPRPLGDVEAT